MSFRLQHPPYFTVTSIPIHVRGRQYSCESGTQNLFSKVFLQCSVGIWQLPSTPAETLSTTKQKAEQPIFLFSPQVYPSLSCGECSRLTAGKSWVQKRTGNDVLPAICWSYWPACSLYPEPALFAKGSDQPLSVSLSGEICSYTVRVNWKLSCQRRARELGKGLGHKCTEEQLMELGDYSGEREAHGGTWSFSTTAWKEVASRISVSSPR